MVVTGVMGLIGIEAVPTASLATKSTNEKPKAGLRLRSNVSWSSHRQSI